MKVLLFLVLISGLGLGDAIFYSKPMKILDIEIPKSLIYILICHLVLVLTCWVVYTKMSMGRWTLIKIMWLASFIASLVTIPRWSSFALNSRNVIWFTWPNWLKMAIFLIFFIYIPRIVSSLEYFPPLNSFLTPVRKLFKFLLHKGKINEETIWNFQGLKIPKKNSCRGNYMRKYGRYV